MDIDVQEIEPGVRWRATAETGERAVARRGQLHSSHDWLEADESVPSATLRELVVALTAVTGLPVSAKATPGAPRHGWLREAGATAYQICPPSQIDCTDPANLAWAQQPHPRGAEVSDMTGATDEELIDLWVGYYVWIHETWSPVRDRASAREVLAPMITEELDRGRSVLVLRDGRPSAHGFVFPEGDGWLVCCEAVARDAPHGTEDVAACLREVVARLGASGERDLLVDGHEDDPHLAPALRSVPHVTGDGLHLLQLP